MSCSAVVSNILRMGSLLKYEEILRYYDHCLYLLLIKYFLRCLEIQWCWKGFCIFKPLHLYIFEEESFIPDTAIHQLQKYMVWIWIGECPSVTSPLENHWCIEMTRVPWTDFVSSLLNPFVSFNIPHVR